MKETRDRIVGQDISWAESITRNVGQNGKCFNKLGNKMASDNGRESIVKLYITDNSGQDGDRVCYLIQNGVALLFEIEWELS